MKFLYITLLLSVIITLSAGQLQTGSWTRFYQSPCGIVYQASINYDPNYGYASYVAGTNTVIFQNVTFSSSQVFTGWGALYYNNGAFSQWTTIKGVTSSQYQFYVIYAPTSSFSGNTDYYESSTCYAGTASELETESESSTKLYTAFDF
ncbi:hypothetical protein DLAC_06167 [Tieghemostelium lacteum]|uniref:Uncharacterized protein n=1 Tax=Tieghemostelium lacteum TaxID=361077 RepID=A0A151ZI00_TIELA|nr:hypothetical protein DLAC_06167 [Tieghemostelium lacteum]|eukprot:KYQ93474.1 hypothetical protein DLAC_06167 [Tieghemostelium lacteum]